MFKLCCVRACVRSIGFGLVVFVLYCIPLGFLIFIVGACLARATRMGISLEGLSIMLWSSQTSREGQTWDRERIENNIRSATAIIINLSRHTRIDRVVRILVKVD